MQTCASHGRFRVLQRNWVLKPTATSWQDLATG
jgi:hypothetical protein